MIEIGELIPGLPNNKLKEFAANLGCHTIVIPTTDKFPEVKHYHDLNGLIRAAVPRILATIEEYEGALDLLTRMLRYGHYEFTTNEQVVAYYLDRKEPGTETVKRLLGTVRAYR